MKRYFALILPLILTGCGLLVDSTPPEVEIAAPSSDLVTQTSAHLSALAVDPESGIKSMRIYVDDVLKNNSQFEADDRGAYELSARTLDAAWLPEPGEYVIRIEAVNGYGGSSEAEKRVRVETEDSAASPDTGPPTVSWNSPQNGAVVSGSVALSAYAIDDKRVTKVEFYAGNTLLHTDDQSPYGFEWDTEDLLLGRPDGPVTLKAIAYDPADRRAEASIGVTLMNAGVPPSLSIASPADGATVGVRFTVTAEVLDLGADFEWVPTNGHRLWVRIYDQVGHLVTEDYLTTNGADGDPEPSDNEDFLGQRTLDLSAFLNEFPLDRFDIIVEGTVEVNGTRVNLSRRNTVNISLESNLPPALLILAPINMEGDKSVFGTSMTVAGRVTDDSGEVDALEVRMVCDACGPSGEAQNKLLFYLDEPYDLFSTGILSLDGTPGANESDEWNLRVVAIDSQDTTLRNIIAVDVEVNRTTADFSGVEGGFWDPVVLGPIGAKVDPSSAVWTFNPGPISNPVKILLNVEHNNRPVEFITGTISPGDGPITYSRSFGEADAGSWQIELILQDTETGVQATTHSQTVAVSALDD